MDLLPEIASQFIDFRSKNASIDEDGVEDYLYIKTPEFDEIIPDCNDNKESKNNVTKINQRLGTYYWPPQFITEFSDITLLGDSGLAFDGASVVYNVNCPNRLIVRESINSESQLLPKIAKKVGLKRQSSLETQRPVLPLVSYRSDNIYHWITEYLPQIELLNSYSEEKNKDPMVLLEPNPPEWKIKSLEFFGITEKDQICSYTNGCVVNRCLLCSPRILSTCDFAPSPRELNLIQKTMVENTSLSEGKRTSFPRNIYITRKNTSQRRIVNYDEVSDYLESNGFVECVLEDMDYTSQVLLFRNADKVIAPHGAGLTHIIYSTDISVIEILPKYFPSIYTVIANLLGLDYNPIIADKVKDNEDMVVDIDDIDKLI